jgi:DNA-binding CsgD family transcriptional regulator
VACLVDGLTYSEVADELGISTHTVNRHVQSIFEKTNTRTARKLVALLRGGSSEWRIVAIDEQK